MLSWKALALFSGITMSSAAGGYGLFNYLSGTNSPQEEEKLEVIWEYISKGDGDTQVCERWVRKDSYQEEENDREGCETWAKNISWGEKRQPEIWIKTNEDKINKVLKDYQLLRDENFQWEREKNDNSWITKDNLSCQAEKLLDTQKVEISCNKR